MRPPTRPNYTPLRSRTDALVNGILTVYALLAFGLLVAYAVVLS